MASQAFCFVCYNTELSLINGALVCDACGTQSEVTDTAGGGLCMEGSVVQQEGGRRGRPIEAQYERKGLCLRQAEGSA